ncbi:NADH dehydrogenase 1 beta subcomplex subunit 8 ndufb8 [Gaertneriomyces sp. JEL0708]|nr:NADH dehydrogenase 1 beta subcomplex subunit 8 ndufb8 [Gaertneriomyces sp. JEL0708]
MNVFARALARRPTALAARPSMLAAARYESTYHGRPVVSEQPEPVKRTAAQIFNDPEHAMERVTKVEKNPSDALLSHPLYTPPAPTETGIGILQPPLKFPEYDQSVPSTQSSGLPSPPTWHDKGFDSAEAPIGDYPRLPLQWAQLKDPFKYWDQQGRRNYGDIVYDHDNFADQWSIGNEQHWWLPLKHTMQLMGVIAFMGFCVHWFDPSQHLWFAEKDYPFDGLRVELGGDPKNAEDTRNAVGFVASSSIRTLINKVLLQANTYRI